MDTGFVAQVCSKYGLQDEMPYRHRAKHPQPSKAIKVETRISDIIIRRKQTSNQSATVAVVQDEQGLIGYFEGDAQEAVKVYQAVIAELRPTTNLLLEGWTKHRIYAKVKVGRKYTTLIEI